MRGGPETEGDRGRWGVEGKGKDEEVKIPPITPPPTNRLGKGLSFSDCINKSGKLLTLEETLRPHPLSSMTRSRISVRVMRHATEVLGYNYSRRPVSGFFKY